MGINIGTIRVGVVRCGPDGILAVPVETLIRQEDRSDADRAGEIIDGFLAVEVIIGLPRYSKGGEGVSARAVRRYALRIEILRPEIRVALVDECLTPSQAHVRLRVSGTSEKGHRPIINQVVAQIIFEQVFEEECTSGRAPGKEITLEGSSAQ